MQEAYGGHACERLGGEAGVGGRAFRVPCRPDTCEGEGAGRKEPKTPHRPERIVARPRGGRSKDHPVKQSSFWQVW